MKPSTFIFPILTAIVFVACSTPQTPPESQAPLAVPVATLPKNSGPALEEMPQTAEETQTLSTRYNPKGRRDPFRSIVNPRNGLRRPTRVGSLPPLQRKDISELQLIGIIWGEFGPKAMITVPEGKGYTVQVGTRIGLNKGVVKRITQNEVVVEETLVNVFGETQNSDVIMELHAQKEGLE